MKPDTCRKLSMRGHRTGKAFLQRECRAHAGFRRAKGEASKLLLFKKLACKRIGKARKDAANEAEESAPCAKQVIRRASKSIFIVRFLEAAWTMKYNTAHSRRFQDGRMKKLRKKPCVEFDSASGGPRRGRNPQTRRSASKQAVEPRFRG